MKGVMKMKNAKNCGKFSAVKISLLTGVAIISATPAFGQDSSPAKPSSELASKAPQAGASDPTSEPIIVTGSLIARSGFDTPTPVTVIDELKLQYANSADIAEVVNDIPSARGTVSASSTSNASGSAGGSYTDLRGLGYQRTLGLVDGRRYAPITSGGTLNTSALPQMLIKGVDIVTGGASAAYGSDAVAGVVNYRLDTDFQGFKGKVQAETSEYGDYNGKLFSLAYGKSFFDDRVHLTVAGDWMDNDGIRRVGDRPWANNVQIVPNPAYVAGNGQPQAVLTNNVKYANASYGGLITSGLLRGIQFAPDGSAIPFVYGTRADGSPYTSGTYMIGGDAYAVDSTSENVGTIPLHRRSLFGNLAVDLSNSVTLFGQMVYQRTESVFDNVRSNETLTIRADNAFLPQSIRDVMAANSLASFTMSRGIDDNARRIVDLNIQTYNAIVGAKGTFADSWSWEVYYSKGHTRRRHEQNNSRVAANFALALDAVVNPLTGAIVCRSTLTNPTNGCVPINLIGQGRASAAALAYTNADAWSIKSIDQDVVSATVRGELFDAWAGPVSIAVGADWRRMGDKVTADPIAAAFAYSHGGTGIYSAKNNVREVYGEILVPLARDEAWAKNLELNLAGRVTDYSTSGTVYTWKAGVSYAVNDSIRLRATRSRDIRAPGVDELFSAGSTSLTGALPDPLLGISYAFQQRSTGNPNVKPEKADTWTAGFVFTPTFIPKFKLSVDYYDISIHDAITTLTPRTIVEQCYLENNANLCALLTRGPNPGDRITSVLVGPSNFQEFSARGIDFEASYQVPFAGGKFDWSMLATHILELEINDPTTTVPLRDFVHQPTSTGPGGQPKWRFQSRLSYSRKGAWVSLTARHVGGGEINPTFAALNYLADLRVNGRTYFDIAGQYPVFKRKGGTVALFGSVRNLLNTDPPLTNVGTYGTTRPLYDVIGRVYRGGVKFDF